MHGKGSSRSKISNLAFEPNLSKMKSQPGDLCPPEGHGAIVELNVRHLGLGLRLDVGVAWQGVGDGLAESLLGGRCGAGDYVLSHSQRCSYSYATYSKTHRCLTGTPPDMTSIVSNPCVCTRSLDVHRDIADRGQCFGLRPKNGRLPRNNS